MSKYDSLWKWIQKNGDDKFSLTYAEISIYFRTAYQISLVV